MANDPVSMEGGSTRGLVWAKKVKGIASNAPVTPRVLLFFYAVVLALAASAVSGAGFVLKSGHLLVAGSAIWAGWFALMFLVAMPCTDRLLHNQTWWLKRVALAIFILLLVLGIAEAVVISCGLSLGQQSDRYVVTLKSMLGYNDSTALIHQASDNFIDGENPYQTANIVTATLKFGGLYDKVTPLREGRFKDVFPYPADEQLKALWDDSVKNPGSPPVELESRLCYPAGSFLLPAPFLKMGISDLRKVFPILILPALGYVIWRIRRDMRILFVGALLISLELWNSIASGETGSLVFPLLLMSWVLLRRNLWLSALFMGLAVATKQISWFFIPFYFILLLQTVAFRRMLYVVAIVAGVFFATNAAFIVADPKLWLTSVMAPMIEPMFPIGIGIVTLVTGGILDIRSPLIFTALELSVAVVAIVWYFRYCRRYPHVGLILAMLPMFFAWRSLWPYFYYTGIILLAVVMIDDYSAKKRLGYNAPSCNDAG